MFFTTACCLAVETRIRDARHCPPREEENGGWALRENTVQSSSRDGGARLVTRIFRFAREDSGH